MSIADEEVTFSELVQRSVDTVARLNGSRRRALRVTRRDAEDLVLTTAARAEQDAEVVATAVRMLSAILRSPVLTSQLLLDLMRQTFPWIKFLPVEVLEEFIADLTETFEAAAALDNTAPVAQTISAWKATAEVYADPEIATALLRGTTGDHGPVPEPESSDADAPRRRRRRRSAP
ncbi:hypothetical protein [Actinopolymorpha alba]|uniref:hypothetical protein n=1 Tax=Actinopolymorpha alba TaxID=533267 RepID=UPI000374FBEC|nr:hypothetical protein [Actinopolymorpha alba]